MTPPEPLDLSVKLIELAETLVNTDPAVLWLLKAVVRDRDTLRGEVAALRAKPPTTTVDPAARWTRLKLLADAVKPLVYYVNQPYAQDWPDDEYLFGMTPDSRVTIGTLRRIVALVQAPLPADGAE